MPARARPDLPFHGSRLVNYPPSRPTIDRPISTTTRAREDGFARDTHPRASDTSVRTSTRSRAFSSSSATTDRPTERPTERTNDRTRRLTDPFDFSPRSID